MTIKIVAVGQKMPAWINAGFEEYSKRLIADWWRPVLVEVPLATRSKTVNKEVLQAKEAELLLSAIRPQESIIALDECGDTFTTASLAEQLKKLCDHGKSISFLIGGPDGLSPSIKEKAAYTWSLSKLTLPHPLVRVVLIEQLYRAYSLLNKHPYHRA